MSCNSMRNLEYEREQEEERKRKRKKKEADKKRREREEKRRQKAMETIKEQAARSQWMVREAHPGVFILTRPGSNDRMRIDVYYNGDVVLDVPGVISPQNHPSSDALLANIADILKGKWKTVKRYFTPATAGLPHSHGHGHAHTH